MNLMNERGPGSEVQSSTTSINVQGSPPREHASCCFAEQAWLVTWSIQLVRRVYYIHDKKKQLYLSLMMDAQKALSIMATCVLMLLV